MSCSDTAAAFVVHGGRGAEECAVDSVQLLLQRPAFGVLGHRAVLAAQCYGAAAIRRFPSAIVGLSRGSE